MRSSFKNFKMPSIGVYLENSNVEYDLRRSGPQTWIVVDADFDMTPDDTVRDFLIRMAPLHPIFGFACAQEELEYRNRITTKFGINTMESWVGRDPQKYIPGLYWWTLLPASLAEQHGISLSSSWMRHKSISSLRETTSIAFLQEAGGLAVGGLLMAELYHSCPGIFDVEKLRRNFKARQTSLKLLQFSASGRDRCAWSGK